MDETATFKVAHAAGDLCRHVHQNNSRYLLLVAVSQVVEEVAFTHKLGYDIERWFSSADSQQLDEIWMFHLFHYRSFFEEIFQSHSILFERFHSDLDS